MLELLVSQRILVTCLPSKHDRAAVVVVAGATRTVEKVVTSCDRVAIMLAVIAPVINATATFIQFGGAVQPATLIR